MKILSLFDGIACGYEALVRAGIKVDRYVAYEIDKNAIAIAKKNHPDIEEMGSVIGADFSQYNGFDMVIGGSPCPSFSIAGKQKGFDDFRGQLFYEYQRALKEVKPVYFFYENVAMKKEFQDEMSKWFGCEPIAINSNLVSAQNRKRLYWTNIKGVKMPEDREIMLTDIVHESEPGFNGSLDEYKVSFDDSFHIINKKVPKGKIGYFRQDSQANRVYDVHGKAVTLCGEAGGGAAKMGQYLFGTLDDGYIRKLTPVECERLQNLPDNYTKCDKVTQNARYKALGNCWTVDVIAHCFSYIKGE